MDEEETGILESIYGLYRQRQNAAETIQSKEYLSRIDPIFHHFSIFLRVNETMAYVWRMAREKRGVSSNIATFFSVFFKLSHCATYHHVVYPDMAPDLCHRLSTG